MNRTALNWLRHSFVIVAAGIVLTACANDAPVGPNAQPSLATDLSACDELKVPAGNTLAFRAYATGVQIYHWNGTGWSFDGPSAMLYADKAGKSIIGSHYSGPTWESVSGSTVVGAIEARCTPDPTAVQWLRLKAVRNEGPGVMQKITFIQRVNTVGGIAPSYAGTVVGEEARVPYETEYLFYHAE